MSQFAAVSGGYFCASVLSSVFPAVDRKKVEVEIRFIPLMTKYFQSVFFLIFID